MVAEGRFRRDLYFRINSFPIHTPALHERKEDIPLLASSLLERVDRRPGRRLSAAALGWLQGRRFEGNIRELRNLIERASLLADGDTVDLVHVQEMAEDLPLDLASEVGEGGGEFRVSGLQPLAELEAAYLRWARRQQPEDAGELARALGVSPRTLYRKLRAAGA